MPTKKKRVGFIPREDVMKIIDKLSIENNLSNSKIIGILVEEALSMRGIFNKNNCLLTQSHKMVEDYSVDFIDNIKTQIDTKSGNHYNPNKFNNLEESNQDAFDLQTYKMFLSYLKFQEMMDKYHT